MKNKLAEKLLVEVLGWKKDSEKISEEIPEIIEISRYKYDNYENYSPGMRFIESLSRWLYQFETVEERNIAYNFIKKNLIFCSEAEMRQLVSMAYPDLIKPILLEKAAKKIEIEDYKIKRIVEHPIFKNMRRKSLLLGLSDGSRIGLFRRYNHEASLSHEQIHIVYDISAEKALELKEKLKRDLETIPGEVPEDNPLFTTIFLVDDFSGSGFTYLRKKENGDFEGKIWKIITSINEGELSHIVNKEDLSVCIILYMATQQSKERLQPLLDEIAKKYRMKIDVFVIQTIEGKFKISNDSDLEFVNLIEKYYDKNVESSATNEGGTDSVKYGFSNCGLPLVLCHNTPNNSIALLWSYDYCNPIGLFPRVTRH